MSKGKIEVPAFFYYGMPHLRVLLRAQNAQSLQFFKLLLSLGKSLRNHFFGSIPMHIELAIFFCFVFWMVFSSTWSVCSMLQLAGYNLAEWGHACKEMFWWAFSNHITGTISNAGNVFDGWINHMSLFEVWVILAEIDPYNFWYFHSIFCSFFFGLRPHATLEKI